MNNHPPPPRIHRPTTTQILHQTTIVLSTRHHLLLILLLSFILLSFHIENETITSFIDNNPSFKSLFPQKPSFKTIEHQDSTALYALGALFVSHVTILLVYVLSQSFLYGFIFVLVVNHILMNTYRKGVILGQKRVTGLVVLRWALRELLIQVMSVLFLQMEDQFSVFKILVRLKFLPYSIDFPWVKGFEKDFYAFILLYFSLDMLISYVLAFYVSVVMEVSRSCRKVFRESFRLLTVSKVPAIDLKLLYANILFSQVFGEFLGSFIQSLMMIYLMVAWMVYYFSMKSIDAISRGISLVEESLKTCLKKIDEYESSLMKW